MTEYKKAITELNQALLDLMIAQYKLRLAKKDYKDTLGYEYKERS